MEPPSVLLVTAATKQIASAPPLRIVVEVGKITFENANDLWTELKVKLSFIYPSYVEALPKYAALNDF